jgi:hypothetical protein
MAQSYPSSGQPAEPLRPPTPAPVRTAVKLGYSHGPVSLSSAWNDSWDGAPDNASGTSAVDATTCAIGAASALGAWGRASCKRLADAKFTP